MKKSFEKLLNSRFSKKELTHNHYDEPVQELFSSVFDALKQVEEKIRLANETDQSDIDRQLSVLDRIAEKTEHDLDEIKTLKERSEIRQNKIDEISRVLTLNEESITRIFELSSELENTQTHAGSSERSVEEIFADVKDLAERAHMYDHRMLV